MALNSKCATYEQNNNNNNEKKKKKGGGGWGGGGRGCGGGGERENQFTFISSHFLGDRQKIAKPFSNVVKLLVAILLFSNKVMQA